MARPSFRRPAISQKAVMEGWRKLHAADPPAPQPVPARSFRERLTRVGIVGLGLLVLGWLVLALLIGVLTIVPGAAGLRAIVQDGLTVLTACLAVPLVLGGLRMGYHGLRTPPASVGMRILSGLYLLTGVVQGIALLAHHSAPQARLAHTIATAFADQFGPIAAMSPIFPGWAIILASMVWRREHTSWLWALLYNGGLLFAILGHAGQWPSLTVGQGVVVSLFVVATGYLLLPTTQRSLQPTTGPHAGWTCRQCRLVNIPERRTCKRCRGPG